MKLAVMQPYLFPYIGYFQLIYAADIFLIYDDVTYIKQGFVNRNSILTNNGVTRFTVPVPGASSNKKISELEFSSDVKKVLKLIEQSYSKYPYFDEIYPIVSNALKLEERSISIICQKVFEDIFNYLSIERKIIKTSELKYNRNVIAQQRLINFCDQFGADCYINSPGGRDLYSKDDFYENGVELKFIDCCPIEYAQPVKPFTPNLSIIDILMSCSPKKTIDLMGKYKLN